MTKPTDLFRLFGSRISENLRQLNYAVSQEDVDRLSRFVLSGLAAAGWRLVPEKPTKRMVSASLSAMKNRRKKEGWVGERRKHAWRVAAAIEAAPGWNSVHVGDSTEICGGSPEQEYLTTPTVSDFEDRGLDTARLAAIDAVGYGGMLIED